VAPSKKETPKIGAKGESSPGGIHAILGKAKGHAEKATGWIQSHPLQAGLIGAGVALGSLLTGWLIFKALKGGKEKSGKGRRNHARSIDVVDAVKGEFPTNAMEKRALLDEIDFDDQEFLEFVSLLPDFSDIDESVLAGLME
jgi:hypothetical protein